MVASGPPTDGAASAFEKIFASYSERALTYAKDRPYAIAGLERRLTDLYKTVSSYGIVHSCLGRSLLWQRAGSERMKKISGHDVEMVPSWSWMKREGRIRYGGISKVNTSWNRDIELGHNQRVLFAPVGRILQGCHIEPLLDTTCKIKNAKGCLIGCIRFDDNDEADIECLGCVVIAWHISNGWTKFPEDTWGEFVDVSWDERLKPGNGNLSYVLVVSCAAREEGYEVEVCRRLGVAVIQGDCLSVSEPPQTQWVV
jgi:hypothetical protein